MSWYSDDPHCWVCGARAKVTEWMPSMSNHMRFYWEPTQVMIPNRWTEAELDDCSDAAHP